MKFKYIFQSIAGFLVSFFLSPLFPLTKGLLLDMIRWAPVSEEVFVMNLRLNLWLLFVAGGISLALPLLAFFLMRKRWTAFSWGLFAGVLITGLPGYVLFLGAVFLANY